MNFCWLNHAGVTETAVDLGSQRAEPWGTCVLNPRTQSFAKTFPQLVDGTYRLSASYSPTGRYPYHPHFPKGETEAQVTWWWIGC